MGRVSWRIETWSLSGFQFFRHSAVDALMRLNERCEKEFQVSSCPRLDYDLERETLTFPENGVPKVLASIQIVDTTYPGIAKAKCRITWGEANHRL